MLSSCCEESHDAGVDGLPATPSHRPVGSLTRGRKNGAPWRGGGTTRCYRPPMPRSAVTLLLLVACGSDPRDPSSDTDATGTAGSTSGGSSESTDDLGAPTSTGPSDTGGSTSVDPTVPPVDSDTGDSICTASYAWGAASSKDVIVVVASDPASLGGLDVDELHAWAQDLASEDGDHVAIAAAPTGNEPPSGAGYEALPLPAGTDPLEIASMVEPSAGFRRPYVPLRLVVVADGDTAWDDAMLRSVAEPVRFAQVDARLVVAALDECDALTGFSALALATAGSFGCSTGLTPASVIDTDDVLAEQPSCVLEPASRPPALDEGESALALYGIAPLGPQSEFPDGPVDCTAEPLGWTVVDRASATLGLCPDRCRAVAPWYVSERLVADLTVDCPR